MNVVTLIGNLTRDPELKTTTNNMSVARFSIAVRRDRKNDKGEYETDFFDVVAFNKQAEFAAKYCKKGNKVCISGSIHVRKWTDRDNAMRTSVEVSCNSMENLTQSETKPQEEKSVEPVKEAHTDTLEIEDEDLPW